MQELLQFNKYWEILVVIAVLGLWFLFPMGVFFSVHRLDKNSDQLVQLHRQRHISLKPVEPIEVRKARVRSMGQNWSLGARRI